MNDQSKPTTCKSCCHMVVPLNAAGRRVVRQDKSYRCAYVVKWPALPRSITGAYDYHEPKARHVWGDDGKDGKDCPVWERRE